MRNQNVVFAALLLRGLCSSTLGAEGAPLGLSVKAIAAGGDRSFAVTTDGTVWEWGVASPVAVRVSGIKSATAVAAGPTQALALKEDGTVWVWGAGAAPAQVSGLSGVTAVSAGRGGPRSDHALALKDDGTVWSWGDTGSLSSQQATPTPVSGLNWITGIAAGPDYNLAVKFDGTVWQWGLQSSGGMSTWVATPRQVNGLSGVVTIAAAGSYGLALKYNGTAWEWNASASGSPSQFSSEPAQLSDLNDVTSVAGSSYGGHRLGLKRDRTVWAWGPNTYGQLGNGTTSGSHESSSPVQVSGLTGVTAIAAGTSHSIALKDDGTLWAWGQNANGQLGIGEVMRRSYPVQVGGLDGVATAAAGEGRSMVLMGDGTVWGWGATPYSPTGAATPAPVQVSEFTDVQAIAAAGGCVALKRDGTVWQWPTSWWSTAPVQIEGLDEVVSIEGTRQVVAKRDGTVWEIPGYPPTPIQVPGLERVVAVVADYSGSNKLALKDDETVWHWGMWYDYSFDVGFVQSEPVEVSGLTGIMAIAAGDIATALMRDGTVWEWSGRATPGQRTGLNEVAAIAVGDLYSMALKRDGTVWAWGRNDYGQLGEGTTTTRIAPVQVAGLSEVGAIAAGSSHALAVKRDGTVWAWGDNGEGQLGDERFAFRSTPVQMIPPGAPDLAIAMSHDADFTVGKQAVYTLTITNIGLMPTAGMITATDTLPRGLAWVKATMSDWDCSAADRVVTCMSSVQIEPGASKTIGLVVGVSSAAWPGVTNLAVVSNESDRNISNNATGDPTVVLPGKS